MLNILLIDDNDETRTQLFDSAKNVKDPSLQIEWHKDPLSTELRLQNRNDLGLILLNPKAKNWPEDSLLEKIQAIAPEIPVIVLLRPDEAVQARNYVRQGAQDFLISHEFDIKHFIRTVQYAIERHQFQRNLRDATNIDPLSNLLNRKGAERVLERQVAWFCRGVETTVVLAKIDDFDRINDRLGYTVGQIVLKETAKIMASCIRITDCLARLEKDEFLFFLPQTRLAEATLITNRLRHAVAAMPLVIAGADLNLIIKSGSISLTNETSKMDALLTQLHLTIHKSSPSATVGNGIPRSKILMDSQQKQYMHAQILDLLKNQNSFRVVKQEIMHLPAEKPVGYEFLSRFCLKDYENPDDFFRMCLEYNLLTIVDHYCFINCIAAAEELPKRLQLHYNLFPSTLISIDSENFIEDFKKNLADGNICVVEISEQQIIGEATNLSSAVRAFKKNGILIALDDVGFGRSHLESIIILEPDIIKIDKKCIIGISQDKARQHALTRLLKILRGLDAQFIAEGVETREDLQVVLDNGIELAQGFLWGKPK